MEFTKDEFIDIEYYLWEGLEPNAWIYFQYLLFV